jgi:gas vesicle protein
MPGNHNSQTRWVIAALGLGALGGILFAPKSGRETRQAIVAGVENSQKYLVGLGREARLHVREAAFSGKKMIAHRKEQVGAWSKRAKEVLRRAG